MRIKRIIIFSLLSLLFLIAVFFILRESGALNPKVSTNYPGNIPKEYLFYQGVRYVYVGPGYVDPQKMTEIGTVSKVDPEGLPDEELEASFSDPIQMIYLYEADGAKHLVVKRNDYDQMWIFEPDWEWKNGLK